MNNKSGRFWGLADVLTTEEAIRVLQLFVASLVALSVLGIGLFLALRETVWQGFAFNAFLLLCTSLVVLILILRKKLRQAIYFSLIVYGIIFALIAWLGSGVRGIIYPYFVLLILVAGLFLGKKASYIFAGIAAFLGIVFLFAEAQGWLVNADRPVTSFAAWITYAVLFLVVARLVNFALVFVEGAFAQARRDLDERLRVEAEIRRLNDELEARISERTAELTASEERYRLIAENITDIVWSASLDWDMKLMYFSPSIERALGYSVEELKQLDPTELLTPESFAHTSEILGKEHVLSNFREFHGAMSKIECQVLRKDRKVLWYEVGFDVLEDADGNPVRVIGVGRDITERKKVEEQEKQRREMLENVIRLGKVIGKVTSLDRCLREVYSCVQKDLGFERVGIFLYDREKDLVRGVCGTDSNGHLIDNSWYVQPVTDDSTWKIVLSSQRIYKVEDYMQTYEPNQYESDMVGVKQHVTVSAWAGDTPVALIAADNQLTGRVFSQDQLDAFELFAGYVGLAIQNACWNEQLEQRVAERTTELEVANRELEATSYTIAHDLRSPARAISGYSRILQEMNVGELGEAGQKYLQRIHEAGLRMGTMVDNLLEFLRIGRVTLRMQPMDVQDLVERLVTVLRSENPERQLEISIGILPECRADPRLLKQVWGHLLTNALKFTRPNQVAKIEIGSGHLEQEQYYFVRDNGVGFDMKYAGQLFGMFNRLHHADDFEGTGVGLAIVQRILSRHGGRIWVEAEEGKGATFFFTLGN